jgi:phytoene dehydrogenase-like protein
MKEVYDIVIAGGGINSLSLAAYLSKCGLSVCICEERNECGGGCENVEPMPGCRIDPHATFMYGAAAPAFEQLELQKFGYRLLNIYSAGGGITSDGRGFYFSLHDMKTSLNLLRRFSVQDAELMEVLHEALMMGGNYSNLVNLLRSIYWTPPPPPHIHLRPEELPWAKTMNDIFPNLYDDEWNRMSTMELFDTLFENEPMKVIAGMSAWYNGPFPTWRGTGIPGFACTLLFEYSSGSPRGGMHSLAHALVRCAMHYGTKIYTNARVEEIIVEDREAKGVIISDESPVKQRKIYADKAVISNTHVQRTFQELVPARELDHDFLEQIRGINLKGGSLFVLSLVTKELPKFIGSANEDFANGRWPATVMINIDSRQPIYDMEQDIHVFNTHPLDPDRIIVPLTFHHTYDRTRSPEGLHVLSPIYQQVPPPEYHRDGPEAVNRAKDEIVASILTKIRQVAPNLTDDKIVATYVNTPYDSSLRNMGFVGGNWMGMSQEAEHWYEKKPLPQLARYRTPIDRLYLCNQTSYPGGLALQAVPYNLMHILIEDLKLKPGDWWYPSPWFIPSNA